MTRTRQWIAAAVATLAMAAPAADRAAAQGVEDKPVSRNADRTDKISPFDGYVRVLVALAIVAGLIYLARYLLRRAGGKTAGALGGLRGSDGPVEILWRSSLSMKQQLLLVRLGRRVILLAANAQGMTALGEITDPQEVAEVLEAVEDGRGDSFLSLLNRRADQYKSPAPDGGAPEGSDEAGSARPGDAVRGLARKIRSRLDEKEGGTP